MFDGELAATERLAESDLLLHCQVDVGSLESDMVLFLENNYDVTCISIRLGEGGGKEGRESGREERKEGGREEGWEGERVREGGRKDEGKEGGREGEEGGRKDKGNEGREGGEE